ncbi:MAG: DNA-3-methyladenine glycosylase family protein [Schleiferiaceae bacterium]
MIPDAVLEGVEHLRNSDTALRAVVDRLEVPLQPSTGNVFEDALSCILDMRIHYTPTNAAFRYKRLKTLYPLELHPDTDVPEDVVAALKLSYQKADAWKALHAIAQRDRWPELDWVAMPDEEVVRRLTDVPGIGLWSAQMILLFTLGRPGIFPREDYQLRKAVCELYGYSEADYAGRIDRLIERWQPHASLAARHLYRWRNPGKNQ